MSEVLDEEVEVVDELEKGDKLLELEITNVLLAIGLSIRPKAAYRLN